MNISAFGTLWSPIWMTLEPTHEPMFVCARCRMACIMRDVLGAACTRFRPWPVSRRRYVISGESRSVSASVQSWKNSCRISFQRVRDWRT